MLTDGPELSDPHAIYTRMANKLPTAKRVSILSALVEGNSVASVTRMLDVSKDAVLKLLEDVGAACQAYQDKHFRNLTCKNIECDEIWAFCHAKDKNVPDEQKNIFGYGSVWTWVAIDSDTKLALAWLVADRSEMAAKVFIQDVSERLTHRVQLTTDGYKPYLTAVRDAFDGEIDYAMLVKQYGNNPEGQKRYSPAECCGAKKVKVSGSPKTGRISTSYVERQNLTMRMGMRRFTRLTNAFSKKVENHMHAISLHFMYYNFCRIHSTLRTTPAMSSGVADKKWTIADIVAMLPDEQPVKPSGLTPIRRG